jgi:prepilin-type N-terminal cleavage/methylation domain-containing protein
MMGWRSRRFQQGPDRSRAFTLIEVIIAVIVLAIAVPPTLNIMDSASAGRVDSINTTRATYLETIVLETIFADMTSADANLGFSALDDAAGYLSTPATGLYARLETVTEPFTSVGLTYSVEIGNLVASDGAVSDEVTENIFRTITVQVRFVSASGPAFTMPVSMMFSEM